MSAVHMHLILTHVPVIGALFVLALLAIALGRRDGAIGRVALWMSGVVGAAAVAVYFTGEGAEEAVEHLPGIAEALIERHEEIALVATVMISVFGAAALGALMAFRGRTMPRWVVGIGFAGMLAVSGVMAYTANLGGQIRHSEIRDAGDAATREAGGRGAGGDTEEDHE